MATYQVIPGGIASVVYIREPGASGSVWQLPSITYMGNVTSHDYSADRLRELPPPVKEAVDKHFEAVFSLPVDARGAYMEAAHPIDVYVEESNGN
jgi:hypothetical protein